LFYEIPAPQGMGNDWKNLPGTAHTDRHHHVCFIRYQLHRERAMTGRIFQALPTQTDTTVALIYRIVYVL